MKEKHLLITGPPGSGKGTLSEFIQERFETTHISTGDLFRASIKANDKIAQELNQFNKDHKGDLAPDFITNKMVAKRLSQPDAKVGFLLDGYPRTINQTKFLLGIQKLTGMIIVHLDDQKVIERLSGRRICPTCKKIYHITNNPPAKEGYCDTDGTKLIQRDDDHPEVIKHRLEVYKKQTAPVITFLHKKNLPFLEINGDYDIKTEKNNILNQIDIWIKTI